MEIPRRATPVASTRILVDYRGPWGLGDLLCSEPMLRGLTERYGADAEIRYRGHAGNAAFAPQMAGPAAEDFAPDVTVPVALFTELGPERYGALEALPSLVEHMCSYAAVAPADPRPRLNLGTEETEFVAGLGLDRLPGPLVAVCADGSDAYRAWPVERFRALAEYATRRGATVIEVGAREKLGVGIDLVGALPIRAVAAVLGACDLYIGNNSGLFHYAQAAGTPCVTVFSLALPERFIHEGALVVPVQRDDLDCVDCMTRDFATRSVGGCTAQPEAACVTGLPIAAGIDAFDAVLDGYVAHCEGPGRPGAAARGFHAATLAGQAQRLIARGHTHQAARFLAVAARLCTEPVTSLATQRGSARDNQVQTASAIAPS